MIITSFPSNGGGAKVDGRNLFVMGESEPGYLSDGNEGTVNPAHYEGETTSTYIPVEPGEILTIQVWATVPGVVGETNHMIDWMWFADKAPEQHIGKKTRENTFITGYSRAVAITKPAPEAAKYVRVDARLYTDGKIKVERGSVPTGYTQAPEDIEAALTDLEKRVKELESK